VVPRLVAGCSSRMCFSTGCNAKLRVVPTRSIWHIYLTVSGTPAPKAYATPNSPQGQLRPAAVDVYHKIPLAILRERIDV
jgi:hypothetical protein